MVEEVEHTHNIILSLYPDSGEPSCPIPHAPTRTNCDISFTKSPMEIVSDHHPLSNDFIPALADSTKTNEKSKSSRLEQAIVSIKKLQEYPGKFNECVITKLKRDLHTNNKREAVKYVNDCFGFMLRDETFLKWLGNLLDYKPCLLKQLLQQKKSIRETAIYPHQHINEFMSTGLTTASTLTNLISAKLTNALSLSSIYIYMTII